MPHQEYMPFNSYFGAEAFVTPTEVLAARAAHALGAYDYDTMVGTGLSGALVVPLLARALGKHFAIVRKDAESTHSCNQIEGRIGRRWVFVDDFIVSGTTFSRVWQAVKKYTDGAWRTELVATYEYHHWDDSNYGVTPGHFMADCFGDRVA